MRPQVLPKDHLATLPCIIGYTSFSSHSKVQCREAYDKIERMKWKYKRTGRAEMPKKISYRLNVLAIHICHKMRATNVQADEASFANAETGHVRLKQHHVGC
jgi:hypothetical protein